MDSILEYDEYILAESLMRKDIIDDYILEKIELFSEVGGIDEDVQKSVDVARNNQSSGGRDAARVAGWILFFPIMLLRELYKIVQKERKINDLIRKEENSNKRSKLQAELKSLKYRQVKIAHKIEKSKEKSKATAAKMKVKDADKAKAAKKAEQIAKMKEKIKAEKAKVKEDKAKA